MDEQITPEGLGYTWFLFGDLSAGHTGARFWQSGPDKDGPRAPLHVLMNEGEKFNLRDESGQIRFEGYIVGRFDGDEPLSDYGASHGCVTIQWERDTRHD